MRLVKHRRFGFWEGFHTASNGVVVSSIGFSRNAALRRLVAKVARVERTAAVFA